jgi:hypothetical protein
MGDKGRIVRPELSRGGETMNIGEERRTIIIEPVEDPLPDAAPEPELPTPPAAPAPVPA